MLPLAEVLQDVEPGEPSGGVLSDEGGRFFAFFLRLAVIARFWLVHHRIVEGIGAYDVPFLLLNLLWRISIGTLTLSGASAALSTTGILIVALLIGTLSRRVDYGALLPLLLSVPVESWLRRKKRAR